MSSVLKTLGIASTVQKVATVLSRCPDSSFGDRLSIGKYLYLWKGRKRVWTFRRYATRICN